MIYLIGSQCEEPLFLRCQLLFRQSSLFHSAYLFRDGETNEVIEGYAVSVRKVVGLLADRWREAEGKTLVPFVFLSHFALPVIPLDDVATLSAQ